MASNIFVGVNGVAKKPKNIYVGVNGVARKVKAAYVGVNGVARQVWSSSILPTTYQRLEYITNNVVRPSSNGAAQARINTGIIPNIYTKVYLKFMYIGGTDNKLDHIIFGSTHVGFPYTSYGLSMSNCTSSPQATGAFYTAFYYSNAGWSTFDCISTSGQYTNVLYEVVFNDNGKFYINNNLMHTATDISPVTIEDPIRIFNYYYSASQYTLPGAIRVYSCKIWNNGTLVRDMYPCYQKTNTINGLYDIVGNVFYSNEVTEHPEDISAGPVVN